MSEKLIKSIRWTIVIVFLSAFALNNIWQEGKHSWAYWVSRFLIGSEFFTFGLVFIIHPKIMMRVCTKNKEDLEGIAGWKFMVFGLVAGIPITILGINFLAVGINRWLEECFIFSKFFCLPSLP